MAEGQSAKGSRKRKYSARPGRVRKKNDQKVRTTRNIALRRIRYRTAIQERLKTAEGAEKLRQQKALDRVPA